LIPEVELDMQIAFINDEGLFVPEEEKLKGWIGETLSKAGYRKPDATISLRIVDEEEIRELNKDYRKIDRPTNVLSFPYETLPDVDINLLGDVVVCANVMEAEAQEQSKPSESHWAHIIIHGTLHLLGYDHQTSEQAEEMESLEIDILSKFNIPNPYGELNTP